MKGRRSCARDQLLAMASGAGLSRLTAGVCRNTHTVNKPREASIHNRKNAKAIMSDPPIRKVRGMRGTVLRLGHCRNAAIGDVDSQNRANRLAKSANALSDKESVRSHNRAEHSPMVEWIRKCCSNVTRRCAKSSFVSSDATCGSADQCPWPPPPPCQPPPPPCQLLPPPCQPPPPPCQPWPCHPPPQQQPPPPQYPKLSETAG